MNLSKLLKDEISNLSDIMVVKDQNSYYLYNTYAIIVKKDHFKVCKLTDSNTSIVFSSLKNAVSWCTLDYYLQRTEARQLNRLELKLLSLDTDIIVQKNLLKTTTQSFITKNKLYEYFHQRKQIVNEIKKITNYSRDLQQRTFNKKDSKKYQYDKYIT